MFDILSVSNVEDTTIRLWIKKQNCWEIFHKLNHSNEPTCVVWSPVVGKEYNSQYYMIIIMFVIYNNI